MILQSWNTIINIVVISVIVTATELTIRWNDISGVDSLSGAGQTISFVIGIGAVIRVLYAARPKEHSARPHTTDADDPTPGHYPPLPGFHPPLAIQRPPLVGVAPPIAFRLPPRR